MNPMATSKEEILKASRELIRQHGFDAVSIRSVAHACGISTGTIYNYFPSKDALVSASVESVWHDIFHHTEESANFQDTLSCVSWLYQRMAYGGKQYPHFFNLHSIVFASGEKAQGREQMQKTWDHIRSSLCVIIKRDPHVRPGAFDASFTPEQFARVLFSLMLSALLRQDYDPAPVLVIIRRTLY